jgi:hypothetical protein
VTELEVHGKPGDVRDSTSTAGSGRPGQAGKTSRTQSGSEGKQFTEWTVASGGDDKALTQEARASRADRRRVHGRVPHGEATGKAANEKVGAWAEKECTHATEHWRKQFRGDAPIKADTEVTDADIKNNNLILWGDPQSNAVLAKIADRLPIRWTEKGVVVGKDTYDAGAHVPLIIYPNPLNPAKYVVLNSGFTFREYDYLNNARQVPKLPDYAVIDISTPANSRYPGKVVRAGFFGEKWELLDNDGK